MSIASKIIKHFDEYIKNNVSGRSSAIYTDLHLKQFYDKRQLKDILCNIEYGEANRIYYNYSSQSSSGNNNKMGIQKSINGQTYNNVYEAHFTDGLIFQSNTCYYPGTDHSLLKWKYYDVRTVDLQVDITPQGKLILLCYGPDFCLIDVTRSR
jgi:hypothetical protein